MSSATRLLTANDLWSSLQQGTLQCPVTFEAMIRETKGKDSVSCAIGDCGEWFDVPFDMIAEARTLTRVKCKEHTHLKLEVTLNPAIDRESQVFEKLIQMDGFSERDPIWACCLCTVTLENVQTGRRQSGAGYKCRGNSCKVAGGMAINDAARGLDCIPHKCRVTNPNGDADCSVDTFAKRSVGLSGNALRAALESGTLNTPIGIMCVAEIGKSEDEIEITAVGSSDRIALPLSMIASAEPVRRIHSGAKAKTLLRIELSAPTTDEARVFANVFRNWFIEVSAPQSSDWDASMILAD